MALFLVDTQVVTYRTIEVYADDADQDARLAEREVFTDIFPDTITFPVADEFEVVVLGSREIEDDSEEG